MKWLEQIMSFPVGPTAKILEGGFKAGRFVYVRKKERKDTDRLIREALAETLCPKEVKPAETEDLTKAIAEQLAATDFPKEAHPAWREKWLPRSVRKTLPGAGDVEGDPFAARLQSWLAEALEAPELKSRLDGFECEGSRTDPEAIVLRFPHLLLRRLIDHPSRFRMALAREIQLADDFRVWGAKVQRDAEAAIAATALTGAGATVAAEALNWSDPVLAGLALATATGLLAAGLIGRERRRKPSPLRRLGRAEARNWIADLIDHRPGEADVSVEALQLRLAECRLDGALDRDVVDDMLEDLVDRLVPLAHEADDEPLVAALRGVQGAALRERRGGPAALRAALTALLGTAEER